MNGYKYLQVRPVADITATRELMDFESILTKALRKKRFLLIRNTLLLILLVSITLLSVFYFSDRGGNLNKKIKSDPNTVPDSISQIENMFKNPKPESENTSSPDSEFEPGPGFENETRLKADNSENQQPEGNDKDQVKLNESFSNVDRYRKAEPLYGFDSLYAYFKLKLIYPEELLTEQIEGDVILKFVITRQGKVGEISVIQSLHPVLDSIAVSCIREMPPWKPASLNDQPVDSKHSIPLIFNIESKELDTIQ